MEGEYTVECEADGRAERFPGLQWAGAVARCEAERVKPWRAVAIRCDETGALIYRYPGAAALAPK